MSKDLMVLVSLYRVDMTSSEEDFLASKFWSTIPGASEEMMFEFLRIGDAHRACNLVWHVDIPLPDIVGLQVRINLDIVVPIVHREEIDVGREALPDVEITPVMIEAGETVIRSAIGVPADISGSFSARDLAIEVYRSMRHPGVML